MIPLIPTIMSWVWSLRSLELQETYPLAIWVDHGFFLVKHAFCDPLHPNIQELI